MRIGYIGEWHDFLWLMAVLGQYDHEFHCINDHALRPVSAKSIQLQTIAMEQLIVYAKTLACDLLIVAPEYEVYLLTQKDLPCLPLFSSLIQTYVSPSSLVNKRWLIGDGNAQLEVVQDYAINSHTWYLPVHKQSNNKHYQQTPILTAKSVSQMKYNLLTYGKQDWLMRKSWKFELRSLKDAAIDTLILANYSMLHREKIRRHHLNRKKINVIGEKYIQAIFEKATQWRESDYSITIHSTDPEGFENTFLSHKKWKWMLERGKSVGVKIKRLKD